MMKNSSPEPIKKLPAYSFDGRMADAISYIVKAIRPEWDRSGVKSFLKEMAYDYVPLNVASMAAIRAAQDTQAQTPKAITWAKYRLDPQPHTGPTDPGQRRCVECTRRQDTNTMTKTEHGWTCQQCTEG